jgi:hypothetical protein
MYRYSLNSDYDSSDEMPADYIYNLIAVWYETERDEILASLREQMMLDELDDEYINHHMWVRSLTASQVWQGYSIVDMVAAVLNVNDAPVPDDYATRPEIWLLMAEAINNYAKTINDDGYKPKSELLYYIIDYCNNNNTDIEIVATGEIYNRRIIHNYAYGVIYMYHPDIGQVSYHDPNNDVWRHVPHKTQWHEWDGLRRQAYSDQTIYRPRLQRMLAILHRLPQQVRDRWQAITEPLLTITPRLP